MNKNPFEDVIFKIEKTVIKSKHKKLRSKWRVEIAQDVVHEHNEMDYMERILQEEIEKEVRKQKREARNLQRHTHGGKRKFITL